MGPGGGAARDGRTMMDSSSVSIDPRAFPFAAAPVTSWTRRAFKGLSWNVAAMFAAMSAVWTLSMTFHDYVDAWKDGTLLTYLVLVTGGTFATSLLTALLMGLPILAAGNLGPQQGWRRALALAACIVAVAPIGIAIRIAYLSSLSDSPSTMTLGERFIVFWFRYAVQAALLTIMAEFHRIELRNVQAMHTAEIDRLALDREMTEARLQVMQAQIEPHFLFNTLANVRRLYQTDLATGRRMLDNLMRYLEVALPRMRQPHSTVDREIGLVEAYLGVQAVRMGRRLAFAIAVEPALRGLALPPMMLLTLVENAIKHGLNPLPEGGRIVISAQRDGERLRLTVRDDGRGFRDSSGAGTGLANIRARLALLHADDAALSLAENVERGITSTLVLPATPAMEDLAA
jgi:signal transduction histidine kinase